MGICLNYCLKVANNNAPFNDFRKLLQNHSVFQHVAVAATTIIRESSACKLEHCCYKTLCLVMHSQEKPFHSIHQHKAW
jgi:hypothetical protein